MIKDLFSGHADIYAKFRPLYPPELFDFILEHVTEKNKALDCGTGNGQAAGILADYFKEVHATDISDKQIQKAIQKPHLHYHICSAEQLPFADNEFDLVTVATALHWFNFEKFFAEVKRVAKNNAVFAAWAYNIFKTDQPKINDLVHSFYHETVHSYWDPERRHVDENYQTIPFPFEEISNPGFVTKLQWNLETLEGYLNTWSAVQHYINKNKENPVTTLMQAIRKEFPNDIQLEMSFPIFMRIGIIKK